MIREKRPKISLKFYLCLNFYFKIVNFREISLRYWFEAPKISDSHHPEPSLLLLLFIIQTKTFHSKSNLTNLIFLKKPIHIHNSNETQFSSLFLFSWPVIKNFSCINFHPIFFLKTSYFQTKILWRETSLKWRVFTCV